MCVLPEDVLDLKVFFASFSTFKDSPCKRDPCTLPSMTYKMHPISVYSMAAIKSPWLGNLPETHLSEYFLIAHENKISCSNNPLFSVF